MDLHPIEKFFLRRIEQHHSDDLVRIQAGEEAVVNAAERLADEHVRRLDAGLFECGVQLAGNILAGEHRFRLRPRRSDRRRPLW